MARRKARPPKGALAKVAKDEEFFIEFNILAWRPEYELLIKPKPAMKIFGGIFCTDCRRVPARSTRQASSILRRTATHPPPPHWTTSSIWPWRRAGSMSCRCRCATTRARSGATGTRSRRCATRQLPRKSSIISSGTF